MKTGIWLTIGLFLAAGCQRAPIPRALDRQVSWERPKRDHDESPREAAWAAAANDDESDAPVSVLLINNETITVDDVLKPVRRELLERVDALDPERYQQFLSQAVQAQVRSLARDALLYAEASKNLTDEEDKHLRAIADEQIRKEVNERFAGRQSRYEQSLVERGSSLEAERERVRRDLVVMRWFQLTITPLIDDPTRDQLWKLYEQRGSMMARPARRDMQMIEVSILAQVPDDVTLVSDDVHASARARALEKAQAARAALLDGEPFEKVATQYSTGLHAQSGGRWGWVTRGSVRERLAPAVDALFTLDAAGVPSKIVEAEDAFLIVQAAAIDPGETPDFQAVQPELVAQFREMQFNDLIEKTLNELQAQADIHPRNIGRFLVAVMAAAPQPTVKSR